MNDQVERLFFEALDVPADERAAFLHSACQHDPDLYREVAGLLEASEQGERFIRSAIESAALTQLPIAGARIGPYRLVEHIGEGGMGVVFLAERADGQFDQQVAIKLMQGGSMAVARFLQERQILARLVHPNIARLIDGGITGEGSPYMVMEYFPGEPINVYCQRRRLSIPERLRLFQQVCDAVEYAHRSLVIHRDLKPSNILVNEQGELKLLDFGIAKLLHQTPSPSLTATGAHFFTPDYASPEQIRGEPVSTLTDVYSLGAVLFELLSDRRPHRLDKYTPAEITQVICVEPAPDLGLGNELDQILQMALRKEPSRRYPSVSHFSEDVDRFLTQRPVRARPDSTVYRLRKFVQRNTGSVIAAAVAVLCLIAGLGIAVWQAQVARREAAAAQHRFQQVRKLARTILFDFEEQVRMVKGAMPARELLAKTAVEYLDSLYNDAQNDQSLRRELAIAYEKVADVQGERSRPNLGQRGNAIRNYRRSAELWDGVPEQDRDFAAYARVYFKLHDFTPGEYLQKALKATERAQALAPQAEATYSILVRRERLLASDHLGRGEMAHAVAGYLRAVAVAEEWLAKHPGEAAERGVCGALESLAQGYLVAGYPAEAIATSERIAAIRQRSIQLQPQDPHHWRQLFRTHVVRGNALANPQFVNLGRGQESVLQYGQALDLGERLVKEDPVNATTKIDLADAYEGLASVLTASAPKRAEAAQQKAIALYEDVVRASPISVGYKVSLARGHLGMAQILRRRGEHAQAIRHADESIRFFREFAQSKGKSTEPWNDLLVPLALRVHLQLDTGNTSQAAADLQEATAILDRAVSKGLSLRRMSDAADVHEAAGRLRRDRSQYEESLRLWTDLRQSGPEPEIARLKRERVAAALARF